MLLRVALEKKPIVISDVRDNEKYLNRDVAKKEGLVSLLAVPMLVKGRVIGVFNLYTDKPHEFSQKEIDTLTGVASQAAIAIENAELMVRTKVIEEELVERKLVEKAKSLLIKKLHMSEEDAYKKIQRRSMDSRKSMREVAEAIILAADF